MYPEPMNDGLQRPTQENAAASNDSVIYKIGRGSKWIVPVTALSAAAVSITRLEITPRPGFKKLPTSPKTYRRLTRTPLPAWS